MNRWDRQFVSQTRSAVDRLALGLTLAFLFECAFGSSGRILSWGQVSLRHVLMIIVFVATAPAAARAARRLSRDIQFWAVAVFMGFLAFGAVLGLVNRHAPSLVVSDLVTFAPLLLWPGVVATLNTPRRLQFGATALLLGIVGVGLQTLCVAILVRTDPGLVQPINAWLNSHSFGGLAQLPSGNYRIYLRSQALLQVGVPLCVLAASRVTGWRRAGAVSLIVVIVAANVLSLTRGFYLGLAAAVVAAVVVWRLTRLGYRNWVPSTLAMVAAVVAVLVVWPTVVGDVLDRQASMVKPIPTQTSTLDSTDSATQHEERGAGLRNQTWAMEMDIVRQSPLTGRGLGMTLDGLRDEGRTEFMYLDYAAKIGLPGLAAMITAYVVAPASLVARRARQWWSEPSEAYQQNVYLVALCGLLSLAITSALNPYLSSPIGIVVLLFTGAAASQARDFCARHESSAAPSV